MTSSSFGGLPGGAALKDDEQRWLSYINDAVIEPSISERRYRLEEV